MWVKGFGNTSEQDNVGTFLGYDADTYGLAIGLDGLINEDTRLGFSGSYAGSEVSSNSVASGVDIDSYQGTIYTTWDSPNDPWYFNTAWAFAWNTYDSTRGIQIATLARTAIADYDGQQYSAAIDGGYDFVNVGSTGFDITPLASLQYSHLHLDGYTETGAGDVNLVVGKQDYDFLQSGLGFKVAYPIQQDNGKWVPEFHAKWLYDFIGDEQQTTSTFTGGGASFETVGLEPEQSSWNLGGSVTFYSKGNMSVALNYDAEVKSDFVGHSGSATVRFTY
jgi:outer membrane autotransporter protein